MFLINHDKLEIITPEEFSEKEYDVIHFQLANSPLHEFQLHMMEDHQKTFKQNSNIITTVLI